VTVWTVKGGRHGEREQRLLDNGLLGGGWEQLPTLEGVSSKEQLAELYKASYPEMGTQAISNYVGQLWSLVHRMQLGDLVVLPLKTTGTVAVGRITGGYAYRDDMGEDLRHCRPVQWIKLDVQRDAFDQDLLYSFGAFLTFAQVRRDNADERVLKSMNDPVLTPKSVSVEEPTEGEEAPDVEAIAREQVRQFVSRNFAGHDLTRVVGAILEAQGFTITVSPPGPDRGIDILGGLVL